MSVSEKECCDYCKQPFEVKQSIKDSALTNCPKCGFLIKKIISCSGGYVFKSRQMNQYSDVKYAKYWRDNNGIRHKVTAADGSLNSPTVSRRTNASPELIEARKKKDAAATSKRLGRIRHGFMKRD